MAPAVAGAISPLNRGDRTGFELFVLGVRFWEPETLLLLSVKP